MRVTWSQVFGWRLRRHLLDRARDAAAVEVAARLVGVQAQVPSAAEQAVAVREPRPEPGALAAALARGELVRTWALRGTLHALPVAEAVDVLAVLAAGRTWERGSWQRTFLTAAQVDAVAAAATEALAAGPLTREQLAVAVVDATGDAGLAEHLRSGWGAVLKPLAWQGLLCQAPSPDATVLFARPDLLLPSWPGLPEAADAGPRVVARYLAAYGPASAASVDQWLLRGGTPKAVLRGWFAALTASGEITEVDVDGTPLQVRTADLDELAAAAPATGVRLLPAFDQYVLGPGTKDAQLLAPAHRAEVSRAAGWIAPVVVAEGRVAGTWEVTGGGVRVAVFPEVRVDRDELVAEAAHLNPGLPVEVTS